MITRQKLATPPFTQYSLVNPMLHPSTYSRLNPTLALATVSQKTVPAYKDVLVPEGCSTAPPPAVAHSGTVQKSRAAMRTMHARASTVGARSKRIATQSSPGAQNTEISTNTRCLELRKDAAGARTSYERDDPTQHEPPQATRKRSRRVQFLDLEISHPGTIIPVASPHRLAQGKRRKLMEPASWMWFHPFVATLERWALGVSATCGKPWTEAAISAAVACGPHTSALTPGARALIDEEMQYQILAGFSEMVNWSDIRSRLPENLKVSPLAVIPQVGRRDRLLLDLSFPVQVARPTSKRGQRGWTAPPPLAPSVNSTTIQQSPDYPVKELGRVLPRLLTFMNTVPSEETIMFA